MAKYRVGQTLNYIGGSDIIKGWFKGNDYKVMDIIPDKTPIGNGETNISGRPMYRIKVGSVIMLFLESELAEKE